MKTLELSATKVVIFQENTIPYYLLLRPERAQQLKEAFGFQGLEIPFPLTEPKAPKLINLIAGETKLGKKIFSIDSLNFENRKIVIKGKGSSHELELALEQICSVLAKIMDGTLFDSSKIILQTYETECIVQLEINYNAIFTPKFNKFLKSNLFNKLSEKPRKIIPKHLCMEIRFDLPEKYSKYNVALSTKLFTIEPRANTPPEDRIFYTKSPLPSDAHLELLKEFEETFKA